MENKISNQNIRQMLDNNAPDDMLNLARNYWILFDHNKSLLSKYPVVVQHAVVEHLYFLSWIPEKSACSCLAEVLEKIGRNNSIFHLFINTYGQRLCDPVSPVCNQSLFVRAATRILNHTGIPEDHKCIVRHWLELALNTDSERTLNNMYNIE